MTPRLWTSLVLFAGILAMSLAMHFGAPPEFVAYGGMGLAALTAILKSMLLPEKPADEEKK